MLERFIDTFYYTGFKEIFIDGKEWEDTVYYNEFVQDRRNLNWDSYKERQLCRWDLLYKDIKENGYNEHNETKSFYRKLAMDVGKPETEIEVGVSRNGKILLIDGIHRLAIAKLLNIEKIPVIVNYWHKAYIEKAKSRTNHKSFTPSVAIYAN